MLKKDGSWGLQPVFKLWSDVSFLLFLSQDKSKTLIDYKIILSKPEVQIYFSLFSLLVPFMSAINFLFHSLLLCLSFWMTIKLAKISATDFKFYFKKISYLIQKGKSHLFWRWYLVYLESLFGPWYFPRDLLKLKFCNINPGNHFWYTKHYGYFCSINICKTFRLLNSLQTFWSCFYCYSDQFQTSVIP